MLGVMDDACDPKPVLALVLLLLPLVPNRPQNARVACCSVALLRCEPLLFEGVEKRVSGWVNRSRSAWHKGVCSPLARNRQRARHVADGKHP